MLNDGTMKILVTSSTGLTGRAVVGSLSAAGARVRAMIHSESRREEMLRLGAAETVVASIERREDLLGAMEGVDAVFYICPTAHPDEGRIGCMAVDAAADARVGRFVYQSVLNSIEPELPHHRQKLRVEQHLLESPLRYTILRPAAFMQNVASGCEAIVRDHVFAQRFFKHPDSRNRINLLDAGDYGEIAARLTMSDHYSFGSYDLCGPRNLSADDMLSAMTEAVGAEVTLRYISDEEFIAFAGKTQMPENKLNTLLAMFGAYNRFGFKGNPAVAEMLLGRPLTDFRDFITCALRRDTYRTN